METLYKFSDWTSVSVMRHPKFSLQVIKENSGYTIRVVNKKTREYDYIFKVDNFSDNTWSLDTLTAVNVLNTLGFNCVFEYNNLPCDKQVFEWLSCLNKLGYAWIERSLENEFVVYLNKEDCICLLKVIQDMKREDLNKFSFLRPNYPVLISGLLQRMEGVDSCV